MKNFFKNIKFEYAITILILGVLSTALFYFKDNKDIVVPIITCLISAFGGIIGYLFTKYTPTNKNFTPNDTTNGTNNIK